MTELVLAEHAHQVDDFVGRGFSDRDRWIALGPSAMDRLEQSGIEYRLLEGFYSRSELGELCEEGHLRLAALCDRLDAKVLEGNPELGRLGMRPFLFNFIELGRMVDGLAGRAFKLGRLFRAVPNGRLWMHQTPAESRSSLSFSRRENLWGQIAQLGPWASRVEFVPEPAIRSTYHSRHDWAGNVRHVVKGLTEHTVRGTTWATCLGLRDFEGLFDLLRPRSAGTILVVGGACEWRFVVRALREVGFRVLFAREEAFQSRIAKPAPSNGGLLESDFEIGGELVCEGVSFFPILKGRLERIAHRCPAEFLGAADRMAALKRSYNLRAVLSSGATSGLLQAIQQAARSAEIPVFVWQHGIAGANGATGQFFQFLDCMTSTVALTWGPAADEAHTLPSGSAARFDAQISAVGAASLDRMRSGGRKKPNSTAAPRRILYATTSYYENDWYFGMRPGFSDCEFYLDQRVLVDGLVRLTEMNAMQAIIKLHPGREHLDPPFIGRLNRGAGIAVIKTEKSFSELLTWPDLVVLDFPSTTLLQAIAVGLPVFVLLRHGEHSAAGLRMLARRAVCARTASELVERLEAYAAGGRYDADLGDSEFLRAYGTSLDDGQSAVRALRRVEATLSRGNLPPPHPLA